jgi:hypothetical protein
MIRKSFQNFSIKKEEISKKGGIILYKAKRTCGLKRKWYYENVYPWKTISCN